MPEGDTIYKVADRLADGLLLRPIVGVQLGSEPMAELANVHVTDVRSIGKHLLLDFSCGLTLHNHLGLYGSWHAYGPTESWRKPAWRASVVVRLRDAVYVCFNARTAALLRSDRLARHPALRRLGPDLTRAEPTHDALLRRARKRPSSTPLADVLLDQTIAAGIGNVYKCEVLFLNGVHPAAALGSVPDARLTELYQTAHTLLGANLGFWPRTTRGASSRHARADRLWVYGNHGQPCFRCGGTIVRAMLGNPLRVTDWCPQCQPAAQTCPKVFR